MCGIVGMMGTGFAASDRKVFSEMLYLDALRGMDGTGVAIIDLDHNARILKKAMQASDFLDLSQYTRIMNTPIGNIRMMLGHNRAATSGGISNETSHPFTAGPITLVHNGSLRRQELLPDHRTFAVDSENIAHSINVQGIEETVKNLNGSFSLVWHNSDDRTINFIRNNERPMFIGKIEKANRWVFGSELGMLEWACERNHIHLESVEATKVLTHYKFDASTPDMPVVTAELEEYTFRGYRDSANQGNRSGGKAGKNRPISKTTSEILTALKLKQGQRIEFTYQSFEPYMPESRTGVLIGWMTDDPWDRVIIFSAQRPSAAIGDTLSAVICGYRDVETDDSGVVCNPTTVYSRPAEKGTVIHLPAPLKDEQKSKSRGRKSQDAYFNYHNDKSYRGPNGILLTGKQFDDLVRDGCSNCTGNIFSHQHNSVVWADSKSPICPECAERLTVDEKTVH